MMKRIRNQSNHRAFTLIELLVVVAIIAMLVGILSVGTRAAMRQARNLKQKAELKAMELGLELFAKDFDGYPESKVLGPDKGGPAVCGAQRLAEALVGRDDRGFEPQTGWYPPIPPGDTAYNSTAPADLYDASIAASLHRRKEPYVVLKNSGFYNIAELWSGGIGSSNIYTASGKVNRERSPVITDLFNQTSITLASGTSVKVGLPVLYFKADGTKRFRIDGASPPATVKNPAPTEYSKWVYNFDDNLPVVTLPVLSDPTMTDMDFIDPASPNPATVTAAEKAQRFYENITQTADPDRNYYKPFNANTFILISAGWDGVYGTKDDITNFTY
jgi:prepilin-type N-terminal cleavage/methylation domain-containing protein